MELLAAECLWDVPPNWDWRGLADLALFIDYRGKTPTKTDSGIRLITAKNVRRGFINLEPEEFITEATYNAWMTRGLPRNGDILFTTEAPMGNAAVVRRDEKFGLAQRVINFRLYSDLDSDFMVLQLLSRSFQMILDKTATGLTAKGIKAAKLRRLPLAVPPLAEQHRIVAKVNELLALCDRLEAQLTTTQTESQRLLEAVLHEALSPALRDAV
jgi:type I restriction enzyme S subunit